MRFFKMTLAVLFCLNVALAADDAKKPTKAKKEAPKHVYEDPELQALKQTLSPEDWELFMPLVKIKTNMGDIIVELDMYHCANTCENFLTYADEGFYEGTIFHRVIPDFMVQAGGLTPDLEKKRKGIKPPIRNESDKSVKNKRGTLAMARKQNPHSATSQFFINLKHNTHLDHPGPRGSGWGYTVFGRVIEGMDVVDKIAKTKTRTDKKYGNGRVKVIPVEPVIIEKVERYSKLKKENAKEKKADKPGARGTGKPIPMPNQPEEDAHGDEEERGEQDNATGEDTNAQEDESGEHEE